MTIDWSFILGLIGPLGAAVAIYIAVAKKPHEMLGMDANAAKAFAEAAKLARDEASQIAKELATYKDEVAEKMKSMQIEIDGLSAMVTERDKRLEELQDWAERLVHQVQSLGGVPVPMKIKRQKETK